MSRRQMEIVSRVFAERPLRRQQDSYKDGVVNDLDPTEISDSAVWDSENWILFPGHAEMRSGTRRISSTLLPLISAGVIGSKSGAVITITSGHTVSDEDVGRYYIHPSGANELIIAVNEDNNQVTVSTSATQAASTPSYPAAIRAKVNALEWHPVHEIYLLLIGRKVYTAGWDVSAWSEVYCTTPGDLPAVAVSSFKIYGDDAYLYNTNGIFKIEVSAETPEFYKVNNEVSTQTITSLPKNDDRQYSRRYLWTLARMSGSTLLNRLNGGVVVQETAPNALDENGKDYAEVFTEKPIGLGESSYGVLTGAALYGLRDVPAEWETITNGQVNFTANSQTGNVAVDFSGCLTFADVADRVQTALRDYWPSARFEFDTDHFVFTMPNAGDRVGYCTPGNSGVDISGPYFLGLTEGTAAVSLENTDEPKPLLSGKCYSSVSVYSFAVAGHASAFFNGKYWVIGGYDAEIGSGSVTSKVWSSTNKSSWIVATDTPGFAARVDHTALVFDNKLWVIGGWNPHTGVQYGDVWYTENGSTWVRATASAAFGARFQHASVVHDGKMWVSGGLDLMLGEIADVWSSSDGATWTLVTAAPEFGYRYRHGMVVAYGKMYVIGGHKEGGFGDDVWYSTDGASWTLAASGIAWGHRDFWCVAYLIDRFLVFGGIDSDSGGAGVGTTSKDIWESYDGVSWNVSAMQLTDYRSGAAACSDGVSLLITGGTVSGVWFDLYRPVNQFIEIALSSLSVSVAGPYTHYSIYSASAEAPDLYVWNQDVPIIKAFVVSTDANGLVTASLGSFDAYDRGSVLILSNGLRGAITSVIDDKRVYWNATEVATSVAAAIGTSKCFTAVQENNIVQADTNVFNSGVVGARIFYSNGATSVITAYLDAQTVQVSESRYLYNVGAGAYQNSTPKINFRAYTDNVSDEALSVRASSYPLKNRFWTPLPDCNIGAFIPGFSVGAVRGQRKIYYTQLADPVFVGYHNSYLQYDIVNDAIQELRVYPKGLSAICAHSVTTWDPEVVAAKEVEAVGELVVTLAQKREVDKTIGCIAWGSICAVENGVDILMTSDNEIRTFDGESFGANIAAQRMMKRLRKLQPVCSASYDIIGGYFLWGTEAVLPLTDIPTILDVCYRFGLMKEHGSPGGIKVTGDAWLRPEVCIGGLRVIDANKNTRQVVFDTKDGMVYQISTRSGPSGSGIDKSFQDKDDGAGGGAEISGALWLKGHTGTTEQEFIRHVESRFFFRPYDQQNRSANAHDADGYRSGTQISIFMYGDGAQNDYYADTQNITKNGDITIQNGPHDEWHANQIKIVSNRSEVVLIGSLHRYASKDKAANPALRSSSESAYQATLAIHKVAWFSRSSRLYQNRVTQELIEGSPVAVTGPDGKARSAFRLSAEKAFSSVNLSSGALLFWHTAPIAVRIGTTDVSINTVAVVGSWTLSYASSVTANGALYITPATSTDMFDIRVYSGSIDSGAQQYYLNDVSKNGGANVCPRW